MTIVYVSDFDLGGSGYCNIGVALCSQLAENGYDVIALGLGYKGDEHPYPFKIVHTEMAQIAPMVTALRPAVDIEAVIVALDIPLQEALLNQLNAPGDIPYIGLFPLESGPLCATWAMNLFKMDKRLVMSEFAVKELEAAGVSSTFIPIGIDPQSWRPPEAEERQMLRRGLGIDDNTFVVLTVADNQERKNLSRSLEIFADFAKDRNAVYWLVTRPDSPVGWKLEDYANDLGILFKLMTWQRGMPFKELWALYAAADAFLLTSKAEGLAMPVLEAMACRLPVVGTRCAAIEEHLKDERGLLIDHDYVMVDPWGNSNRYMASKDDGAYKLKLLASGMTITDKGKMLDRAQGYTDKRAWSKAGQVLIETIKKVAPDKEPVPEVIENELQAVA